MATFDVFPFFDELDLLDIRLNTLNDYVDYFVISEFSTSFAGNPKPFYFDENVRLFEKFKSKIIHLKNDQKNIASPFENDDFQKNVIRDALQKYLKADDVIIFGDVDEIPNPSLLPRLLDNFKEDSFFHFAQDISYGYLNFQLKNHSLLSQAGEYPRVLNKKWLGTIACSPKILETRTISQLRYSDTKSIGKRLANGGWHFSYCGGLGQPIENRVRYKIINNAHQEFNNENVLSHIEEAFQRKGDLLGRRVKRNYLPGFTEPKFKKVNLKNVLPDYISLEESKFSHLLLD
jgi:beta-1,4-mannosyl-glycoprotein beta-1,4-N-acetylglucosaminyltransferase